jgi:diguanylate cyclase (GGDEF)-like protein
LGGAVKLSLRKKITLAFASGLILVTLILVSSFSNEVSRRYQDLLLERANNIVDQLVFKTEKLLALGLYPEEFTGYEGLLEQTMMQTEGILSITLTDKNGKVHYQVIVETDGLTSSSHLINNPYFKPQDQSLTVRKPIHDKLSHQAYVVVVMDSAYISRHTLAFAKTTIFYATLIAFLSIVGLLMFLRSNLGQPLKKLVEDIQTLDLNEHDYVAGELTKRKDEIGIVARSFEELILRLANNRQSLAKSNAELLLLTEELENRVEQRTFELRCANEKLESLAHNDFLTGLSNRHSLKDILDSRFTQAEHGGYHFAIVMLDLDGFKSINDGYGHAAGDIVLGIIGQRMRKSRFNRTKTFRYGGDEFVLLVEGYENETELQTIISDIRHVILEPIYYAGERLPFSVSIGIASSEHFGFSSSEKLLELADSAMYQAKRNQLDYFLLKNS